MPSYDIRENVLDLKAEGWEGAIEGPNGWHPGSIYFILPELGPGDLVSVLIRGQHFLVYRFENEYMVRSGETVRPALRDEPVYDAPNGTP